MIRTLAILSMGALLLTAGLRPIVEARVRTLDDSPGIFDGIPDIVRSYDSIRLRDFPPFDPLRRTYVRISANGIICLVNPADGAATDPLRPFAGSTFPIDFAFGSTNGDGAPDLLVAGPHNPLPPGIFRLFNLDQPIRQLGEVPFDDIATGGFRSAIGNFIGDRTSEILFASGPGGSGRAHMVGINNDTVITFDPFPGYRGGVFVAAADVDGDGHAEALTTQESGGELAAHRFVGNSAIEIGRTRGFGPTYNGGMRVTGGDLNNDGRAETVISTITGTPLVRVLDTTFPAAVVAEFSPYEVQRPGGVTAATGLEAGQPFIITTSGHEVRRFNLQPDGLFARFWSFSENPFQMFIDIFMDVKTSTTPR
jgi:hypothetical protein